MPGGKKDMERAESWLTERLQTQVRKRTGMWARRGRGAGTEQGTDRAGEKQRDLGPS